MDDDVTLGELWRGMIALERRMTDGFSEVNRRFDHLEFVPRETYNLLAERVQKIEDAERWRNRTLVAAFLFPCIVTLITALVVTR